MGDFNCKLNPKTDDEVVGHAGDWCTENFASQAMMSLMRMHRLAFINTYYHIGGTYFHGTHEDEKPTRIDYVCLPSSFLADRILSCKVWHGSGRQLQHSKFHRRLDHTPLVVKINVQHMLPQAQLKTRWSANLLVTAVQSLPKRQAFQADLENWAVTNKDQLMEKMMGDDVDEVFQQVNGALLQIGQKHFTQDQTWSAILRGKMSKKRDLFVQKRCVNAVFIHSAEQLTAFNVVHKNLLKMLDDVSACMAVSRFHGGNLQWLWTCNAIRRQKRAEHAEFQKLLCEEIDVAWKCGRHADVWQFSRMVTGRYGPKKRYLRNPRALPSPEELLAKYGKAGREGGFDAQVVQNEEVCASSQRRKLCPTLLCIEAAEADYKLVAARLKAAKLRKQVPTWSSPSELWRMAFNPHDHRRLPTRDGVGATIKYDPQNVPMFSQLLVFFHGDDEKLRGNATNLEQGTRISDTET